MAKSNSAKNFQKGVPFWKTENFKTLFFRSKTVRIEFSAPKNTGKRKNTSGLTRIPVKLRRGVFCSYIYIRMIGQLVGFSSWRGRRVFGGLVCIWRGIGIVVGESRKTIKTRAHPSKKIFSFERIAKFSKFFSIPRKIFLFFQKVVLKKSKGPAPICPLSEYAKKSGGFSASFLY